MTWLKVEVTTPEKPELHQVAAKLRRDIRVVFFHWFRLWVWADGNVSEDGLAKGMNLSALSRVAGLDGLAEGFCEAGWLTQEAEGVRFTNWTRHNGSSAKTRAQAAKRKEKSRKCHASSVTGSSLISSDLSLLFEKFWDKYPRRVGKDAARRAWAQAVGRADPQVIIAAAAEFADSPAGKSASQWVPHPSTWLNGGRWDDDRAQWQVRGGDDKQPAADWGQL